MVFFVYKSSYSLLEAFIHSRVSFEIGRLLGNAITTTTTTAPDNNIGFI